MAWQDRSYYRDDSPATRSPLHWLLFGSVPLFTVIGIRVRMHASMLVFGLLWLIIPSPIGYSYRLMIVGSIFSIVLLHEFGHCIAARKVGGEADEIIMTPIGGVALTNAPRRPWPQLITVVCGPLVNVAICLIAVALLFLLSMGHPGVSWNPIRGNMVFHSQLAAFIYFIYSTSLGILIFNLIPIYPLDGGRMLQAGMWFKLGYYRATMYACRIGIVGAIIMMLISLPAIFTWWGGITFFIYGSCLATCIREHAMLKAEGPWAFEDESTDYSAAMWQPESSSSSSTHKRKKLSKRAVKKLRRLAHAEEMEQKRIDEILAKVSSHGMASLTWAERRELRKATERQRDIKIPSNAQHKL